MSRVLALCCVLLVVPARNAAAEWHLTPLTGLTSLGSTNLVDTDLATDKRHWEVGGSVALLGPGILGAEVITLWTPGFFQRDGGLVESRGTVSAMANIVLTTPRRWTEYNLRPFVSAGFGLMHASFESDIFQVDSNLAGFNIGGGAVGFLTDRTGLRFDIRYHSTLNASDEGAVSFGDVRLRYVTASVGIVFRR